MNICCGIDLSLDPLGGVSGWRFTAEAAAKFGRVGEWIRELWLAPQFRSRVARRWDELRRGDLSDSGVGLPGDYVSLLRWTDVLSLAAWTAVFSLP